MKNKTTYPVGTKIRFTYPFQDNGLEGTIVGHRGNYILVFLPRSTKGYVVRDGIKLTWTCRESDFEVLTQQNGQLLFDFMHE